MDLGCTVSISKEAVLAVHSSGRAIGVTAIISYMRLDNSQNEGELNL